MSIFEIVLLAITIFVLLSIVWSTVRLGISPMPSSRQARQAMLRFCEEIADETAGPIYELGSGWGNMVVALAKRYPQRTIIAYELSMLPWLVSVLWVKVLGLRNVQVRRQNFLHADLSDAAVMVCYLYPKGMLNIKDKLNRQAGKVEYVISHHFALPSFKPVKTIQLNDLYKTPVYLYRINTGLF
ncbi:MAG: hypothetical protein ACI8SR_001201 [Oceanicoccus sp.]